MPKKEELKESKFNFTEIFIPALVVLAIGLAFFSGTLWQKVQNLEKGSGGKENTTETTQQPVAATVSLETIKGLFDKDLIKFGDAERKVLFVEISDPSCPYCHIAGGYNAQLAKSVGSRFQYVSDGGSYVPPVTEIEKLVKDGKASFVYIYYPGHGNGEMATKALYCANEQGKFWEVNKLLMSAEGYAIQNGSDPAGKAAAVTVGNDKTKSGDLAQFLKSAIDPAFMKSCLDSGKYDARLQSESDLATSLGLQGTPDFYVNATNFPGAYSYTDMKSTVDEALK
jgi:protein-disulfide isomerase